MEAFQAKTIQEKRIEAQESQYREAYEWYLDLPPKEQARIRQRADEIATRTKAMRIARDCKTSNHLENVILVTIVAALIS